MPRFDRYMLGQLMVVFGFFSLVLVLIYWINAAVRLFDQLIADGQGAATIVELILLSLPGVIRLALPISAFAASVYVTNRMTQDSELVVMQATGFGPWRMARPVLYFGLVVAVLMSALTHLLVPLSTTALNVRQAEIAQNITARILTAGQFIEPTDGITLYIRAITPEGEMQDVFLSDLRDPGTEVTYTARRAYLVRDGGDTQLVMLDGMAQSLRVADTRLFVTEFADFSYNIGGLLQITPRTDRTSREVMTIDLLRPTAALEAETGRTAAELVAEGHDRIGQALLGTVAALLGFAALITGSFSRFGLWPRIVGAVVLIIAVKALETVGMNAARTTPQMWFAAYLAVAAGFAVVTVLLMVAGRPYLFHRKPAAGVVA
ncbi:lipopolysaccharide export system permease protein [Loktanella fryxellensis]|uniref:Lipopolysaccharide export system permease protein n=1 Tax=Loktanella fryxellensis TaxID=245187 RepID=A0A1H8F5Z3_9RHOB|nr:LPS export ABC transporter permease LptF [Loktanella fryxellensis]SEN26804.1 lipopolysaccharide export system permease protein [Loktanella fryxellensis]